MINNDVSQGKERVNVPVVNELDDEKPSAFGYTLVCIAGPNVSDSFNSPFYPGCECHQITCVADACSCMQAYGPCYDNSGCLLIYNQQLNDYCQPVFECNSCCACPETCPNRVVQKGLQLKLQVFKTKHKGWGLKTQQTIRKFTFVCEYAGELISVQEAEKRAQKLTHETGNYLIVLREHSSENHILRTHVDAHFHGNASRFINHSCNPNLVMVPVRVDSIVPRLALFATRDIDVGEELSFDYSGEFRVLSAREQRGECKWQDSLRELGKEPKSCFCGSLNCMGVLPFDASLYMQ